MKQDYTFRFLLKYLYGETTILQKLEIENAIQEECSTASTYVELKKGYDKFPKVSFYPSTDTINAVLNYSKKEQLSPGF
jgi:hypothetical protein